MFNMFIIILGENQDIIKISNNEDIKMLSAYFIDELLE